MTVVAALLLLGGSALAALAGVGLIRFGSTAARLHAAGKASPVAFILVALGGALELGAVGAARIAVSVAVMMVTLPVGVHLLFRSLFADDDSDPQNPTVNRSLPVEERKSLD